MCVLNQYVLFAGVRLRLHNPAAGGGVAQRAAGAAQRAGPHRARHGPRAAVPPLGARHLRVLLLPAPPRAALQPRALALAGTLRQ